MRNLDGQFQFSTPSTKHLHESDRMIEKSAEPGTSNGTARETSLGSILDCGNNLTVVAADLPRSHAAPPASAHEATILHVAFHIIILNFRR